MSITKRAVAMVVVYTGIEKDEDFRGVGNEPIDKSPVGGE